VSDIHSHKWMYVIWREATDTIKYSCIEAEKRVVWYIKKICTVQSLKTNYHILLQKLPYKYSALTKPVSTCCRVTILQRNIKMGLKPLNAKLNPICHLLALLGGATIVVVSRLRVNIIDCAMINNSYSQTNKYINVKTIFITHSLL
jgi:hypothetical protein